MEQRWLRLNPAPCTRSPEPYHGVEVVEEEHDLRGVQLLAHGGEALDCTGHPGAGRRVYTSRWVM